MKLTLRIGAAIGIVALAACAQENSENLEAETEMSANETVLPVDEGGAESDTLGNQLNQLNESGENATSTTENTMNSQ